MVLGVPNDRVGAADVALGADRVVALKEIVDGTLVDANNGVLAGLDEPNNGGADVVGAANDRVGAAVKLLNDNGCEEAALIGNCCVEGAAKDKG